MSRQSTFTELADAFGLCVATTLGRGPSQPGASKTTERIRKIARLLDHLARRPANRAWHARAEKLQREIDRTLHEQAHRPAIRSLWTAQGVG